MAAAPTSSPPPFVRLGPAAEETPLVLSVPHAGRHYPAEIERDRAVSQTVLEGLEDRYADRLVLDAVAAGAVAIVATRSPSLMPSRSSTWETLSARLWMSA